MSFVLAFVLGLAAVAVGLAFCHREVRALRRAVGALDEGNGRRAAAIVAGLQSLREPLEAIRAGVEELSPNRRETVEQRAPLASTTRATVPETTGLRLDLPRATDDDRDSEGETRLVRQPTAAELLAAGAVRATATPEEPDARALAAAGLGRPRGPRAIATRPLASGRTPNGTLMSMPAQAPASRSAPRSILGAVCRMCEGGGVVRARSGALEGCRGCDGSGYIDPAGEDANGAGDERKAQLPG